MSEPTLTDEQRGTLDRHAIVGFQNVRQGVTQTVPEPLAHCASCGWMRMSEYHFHLRDEVVAAMLADERAAREAAEAKVRDLTAGIGALAEPPYAPAYPADLRALVDDPAAALAEVRAETLRNQRDFFKAIDMPAAADHCEQSAIGWDSSADDARRRAEAEGAGR